MHHWIYENMSVILLAGLSGFDLIRRFSGRIQAVIAKVPLAKYLKVIAALKDPKPRLCNHCGIK
jgi:hypothetical protein